MGETDKRNRYELIIIGTGPAGYTAAIYASRARIHTLLLEKNFVTGGQIISTPEVDNYPGMPGISGQKLAGAFKTHCERLGISSLRENVREIRIDEKSGLKIVYTSKNTYEAKAVIIATGARHRLLGVKGEEELAGMGVSYCAACDGAFYKDLTVAVVGGGNTAVEDGIFLSRICKKVYFIHRRDELRADRILQEKLFSCSNVEICWNTVVEAIKGEEEVERLVLKDTRTGSSSEKKVKGVFIAVGLIPNTEDFAGIAERNEEGYFVAGENCRTSTDGIFAAGDVRTKELRQIITAAADGANAVYSVQKYLLN